MLRESISFGGAAAVAYCLTPLMARVAVSTGFLDQPAGYKAHAGATPYLGGLAVIGSVLAISLLVDDGAGSYPAVIGAVAVLAVLGTIDDRHELGIGIRLLVQLAAAVGVWAAGIGWQPTGIGPIDLAVTVVWLIGIANAFNLLDNIDGSTGSVGATCAAGIGILAIIQGDSTLAALALALCGACLGFLRHNLASPSRIFLGDGGSVPIGFLLGVLALMVPTSGSNTTPLLAAVPLVGVAVFDTTLVVVSRLRRGVPVLEGGRDHLTHRLLTVCRRPITVAFLLIAVQSVLSGLGIALWLLGEQWVLMLSVVYLAAGAAVLARLETPPFRPRPGPAAVGQAA